MSVAVKAGVGLTVLSLIVAIGGGAAAETRPVVLQAVNDADTTLMLGNTRPEANARNDRGRVGDDLRLEHMQLLLKRPPEAEAALRRTIDDLHNPASPDFHRWMSAAAFGATFGPNTADIGAVSGWLAAHGFQVSHVQAGRLLVDFSGTAGQVREAFHTELHRLDVQGVRHIANMSDPRIPSALAGVVSGVVSLHDFRPHTNFQLRPAYTVNGLFGKTQYVVPADLATIYDLNPLFAAGISGRGQGVVVIEDTDVYNVADWASFRSKFGLSKYKHGSFAQVHPAPLSGPSNCADPGVVAGNEVEAELDAQWASAAAPSAAIKLAACADTATTFGGLIALQNLIDSATPPAIVSISYGECEAQNGATANAAFSAIYQQAVALGTSVFVAAGDQGAASCDANVQAASHGIAVSGFATTPYNVAVGGTDFGDAYAGTTATYWNNRNGKGFGSAKSYIPEIPWNNSCASGLIAAASGYPAGYGSGGLCNSFIGQLLYLTTGAGSGGPSGCATGAPSTASVVSGTCQGTPKPAWQAIVGNPADGVRDIPDVSLFAASGTWGHSYLFCDSDTPDGGSCMGAPGNWTAAGGTSFAAPILAAIQALVNQKQGGRQGNPNPVYYRLANAEYGTGGSAPCNSSNGNTVASTCIFYDVTLGDMDVDCVGTQNCYTADGTVGALSITSTSFLPAFTTGVGWDFATGIGSLNAANLVNGWK